MSNELETQQLDTRATPQHLKPPIYEYRKIPGVTTLIVILAWYVVFSYKKMLSSEHWHAFRMLLPLDLEIYLDGGKRVLNHTPLYDGDINVEHGLPFTYPPFSGWVFSWLARANYDAVAVIWYALTAFSMLAIILMVFHTYHFELSISSVTVAGLLTLATMTLEPVHSNMYFGQINIFLMLLVCLDFLLPEGKRLPGIGTGLAAGLKLTPALFGVIFLFQRRWWAAAGSFLTFAATVVIGNMTVVDGASYWTGTFKDSTRIGDHTHPAAQSLKSVLVRVYDQDSTVVWAMLVGLILAVMCVVLWGCVQRDLTALSVAIVGIVACVISPFSWTHHYVWLALFIVSVMVHMLYVLDRVFDYGGVVDAVLGQGFALVSLAVGFVLSVPFVASSFFISPTYSVLVHDNPARGHWFMWTSVAYVVAVFVVVCWQWAWGRIPMWRQNRKQYIQCFHEVV